MPTDCFDFLKYCNEQTANKNEELIAKVILGHLHEIDRYFLDDISREASISTASVSRFIKNAGFPSFREFKNTVVRFGSGLFLRRSLSFTSTYSMLNMQELGDVLYAKALQNLESTHDLLDIKELYSTVMLLKKSRQVLILGDAHELQDFFTFQLDLFAHGIPCYLINLSNDSHAALHQLSDQDCVLYIDLARSWFAPAHHELLKLIQRQGCPIAALCQEDDHLKNLASRIHLFGVRYSMNDGYYSLPYLCRIKCEMLYFSD